MEKQINSVAEFHNAFMVENAEKPQLLSKEDYDLRFALMKEENDEYLEACQSNDLVGIADALGDQLYILCGTILKHGMQDVIQKVFAEIHESNMSKLGPDGKPLINGVNMELVPDKPYGKILKSENYRKPDIDKILKDD